MANLYKLSGTKGGANLFIGAYANASQKPEGWQAANKPLGVKKQGLINGEPKKSIVKGNTETIPRLFKGKWLKRQGFKTPKFLKSQKPIKGN